MAVETEREIKVQIRTLLNSDLRNNLWPEITVERRSDFF